METTTGLLSDSYKKLFVNDFGSSQSTGEHL